MWNLDLHPLLVPGEEDHGDVRNLQPLEAGGILSLTMDEETRLEVACEQLRSSRRQTERGLKRMEHEALELQQAKERIELILGKSPARE